VTIKVDYLLHFNEKETKKFDFDFYNHFISKIEEKVPCLNHNQNKKAIIDINFTNFVIIKLKILLLQS